MLGQIDISKRQAEIADLVQKAGFASVEDLADRFDVTTQTIRRDVNGLVRTWYFATDTWRCRTSGASVQHSLFDAADSQPARKAADSDHWLQDKRSTTTQSVAFSIGTTPEIVMQALVTGHDKAGGLHQQFERCLQRVKQSRASR